MAKEGTETAEETEQMIEKNGAKEPESAVTAPDSKEMRAVLLSGFGGLNKLKVTKKTMPEPQEGEVKIRVKAWYSMYNDLFLYFFFSFLFFSCLLFFKCLWMCKLTALYSNMLQ